MFGRNRVYHRRTHGRTDGQTDRHSTNVLDFCTDQVLTKLIYPLWGGYKKWMHRYLQKRFWCTPEKCLGPSSIYSLYIRLTTVATYIHRNILSMSMYVFIAGKPILMSHRSFLRITEMRFESRHLLHWVIEKIIKMFIKIINRNISYINITEFWLRLKECDLCCGLLIAFKNLQLKHLISFRFFKYKLPFTTICNLNNALKPNWNTANNGNRR